MRFHCLESRSIVRAAFVNIAAYAGLRNVRVLGRDLERVDSLAAACERAVAPLANETDVGATLRHQDPADVCFAKSGWWSRGESNP